MKNFDWLITSPRRTAMRTLCWGAALWLCMMVGCGAPPNPDPQQDEAMKRAVEEKVTPQQAADFFTYRSKQHVPDFFKGMDAISRQTDANGVPDPLLDTVTDRPETRVVEVDLSDSVTGNHSEVIGRNTWMAWCGGNEFFWDYLANDSLGFIDFVKLVDSRKRNQRFDEAGMINEPGMTQATSPPKEGEFGLWLDRPDNIRHRQWRDAYLKQTFEQIAKGTHVSQIGLNKRDPYGEFNGPPLYRGDPRDKPAEQRYRYPSQYLPDELREELHEQSDEDPYDNEYDRTIPPPDMYGISSGIIGLRLFPNPYFDAEARKKWNSKRYFDDKTYWTNPKLIRPFRVGMSCAFCHASFHPLRPPADHRNPEWTNLSGSIGAQYISMRATVGNLLEPDQFVYHVLESQPRGTIDTSLIASDNVNNPNTMNAVFGLPQRVILSLHNPKETLSQGSMVLPSLWDDLDPTTKGPLGDGVTDPVPEYWQDVATDLGVIDQVAQSNDNPRSVPRILLDGSDGIGTWGALARVYLNIGSYGEQWNELHQVAIGFKKQKPFRMRDCESSSVYWKATTRRVPGLRDYFLRVTPPMPLLSTDAAEDRLESIDEQKLRQHAVDAKVNYASLLSKERAMKVDRRQLAKGREVFVKNCIVCHSSIQPESASFNLITHDRGKLKSKDSALVRAEKFRVQSARAVYQEKYKQLIEERQDYRSDDEQSGEFWEHDPARWLSDESYQAWAIDAVERPEFWKNNYLSTDYRVPVNLVGTNSARAMGTNSMTGHLWEDFASESYRNLPSPGSIRYFNPYKGEHGGDDIFTPRHTTPVGAPKGGGGPGYYRAPSLISIWATAPLLHNNSLGLYNNDPSVDGRLKAFDDAIRKMLWKEKRRRSSSYNGATPERLQRDHGLIWRTSHESYLTLDSKRVPSIVRSELGIGKLHRVAWLKWLKIVSPTWLPSATLLLGALLTLLLGNSKSRRPIAVGILVVALLFSLLRWFVVNFPELSILSVLRSDDLWLPVTTLAIVGLVLWLPVWGDTKLRRAGVWILIAAMMFGGISVLAQVFPTLSIGDIVRNVTPGWMPLAIFGTVAVLLLLPCSPQATRYLGYATTALSLIVGVIVYFNAGELGDLRIGPIPAGTPVNLLANFNSEADRKTQIESIYRVTSGLAEIRARNLGEEDTQRVMKQKVAPALMKVNKCPDFVMDRGHYFPWFDQMTDGDKNALIELLKTF